MPKEKKNSEKLSATFEKDSKRFRRFLIDKNDLGIVGTLYVPKGNDAPDKVSLSFED